ncbi:peptidase S10 [Novosphingobium sp. BL-8A]|uniref:S10 family peptidase n=1 Tax=Novosphingobium sp. BL-8A TaxID=3127639 RepID=UPI003756760B
MKSKQILGSALAGCVALLVPLATAAAEDNGKQDEGKQDSPVQTIPPLPPSTAQWHAAPEARRPAMPLRRFVAKRSGNFAGQSMKYTVVAEDTAIPDALGTPKGSIFSFSYMKDMPAGSQRPVMFIFNGGPGSASIWLHMGVLGPRKAAFNDVNPAQVPPFRTVENPDSVLAEADLVFIDPIGTGFSRYWGEGGPADFYGTEQDAASVVRFIEIWLRKHHRWNSPRFVLGESYGTTRAALLSRRLMGGVLDGSLKGISLNGVILVGGDGGLSRPEGNAKFLTTFTTMAATAWYHGLVDKTGRDFDSFIGEADAFAQNDLVPALDRWDHLDAAERARLAKADASFTGLKTDYLLAKGLRVMPSDYATEVLKDKGENVGFYDSRYVLPAQNSLGDPVADDGAMGQYTAAFVGAFNSYVRDDLGIDIDDDYVNIDFVNVNFPFQRPGTTPKGDPLPGEDSGADLAAAMRRNPDLRLMSIQGWFDMFGAVGNAKYGIAQRHLPTDRVVQKSYWSGHMAYVGDAGIQMASDLKEFIRTASKGRQP